MTSSKNTKIEKKSHFWEKIIEIRILSILHPINAKMYYFDDSECISSKFILEMHIQLHTKYTWF